jgi:hypothetical protein
MPDGGFKQIPLESKQGKTPVSIAVIGYGNVPAGVEMNRSLGR